MPDSTPRDTPDLRPLPIPETLAALGVAPDRGLESAEVARRIGAYGYNEVVQPPQHPVLAFLAKFWGVSAWMLELILVLSVVLGKYTDAAVVGALLVVNAAVSFGQEQRASGVVASLRRRLQVSARVLRDARWQLVPAREIVPGDVLRLRAGDIVPADVKLLSDVLALDQSTLTGETADVEKAPGDVLPSASVVRRGEGNAVVLLTGARTSFGRTTELVQTARPRLHIEGVVAKVVRTLFAIVAAIVVLVGTLSVARGLPLLDTVPLMLVLLMSAVPVALPVMFTVSMALGSAELARRGVLVTRLSAAEDAATLDTLCVDKTGTITMNRLTVTDVIPLAGATQADVVLAGALASREENQDPIDLAFLAAAQAHRLAERLRGAHAVSFQPFDAHTRRTVAIVERDGVVEYVTKGAVRAVADACRLDAAAVAALEARAVEAAAKGYRTLAVARGATADAAVLIGLVSLYDPPRPDASSLIAVLRRMGVSVKMLTGDALPVARETGREVGLPEVRSIAAWKQAAPGSAARAGELDRVDGFAEVYPEDKYVVVKEVQDAGHVAGMTGDGVNDAPALRQAEVGIAVSSATDVAKGAASVVLTEPGLTNIVALIEQGRTIFQRVLTWIVNKISRTILKCAFVAIAFLATGKFVVSAFAMLLLTFMTDFAKVTLATDRVQPSQHPETWALRRYVIVACCVGAAMTIEALALLGYGWTRFGLAHDDSRLCTFSFLTLLYFAVFSILSTRERGRFWKTRPSRPLALALCADALAGTALAFLGLPGLGPLPLAQTAAIFFYSMAACLLVNDALKVALLRRLR